MLLRGGAGLAKILAGVALVVVLAVLWRDPLSAALTLPLYAVPVFALATGFHRDAPKPRSRWALVALPAVLGVFAWAALETVGKASLAPKIDLSVWSLVWPWLDPVGLACLALLGATVVHLAWGARRSPFHSLALAVLAVPILIARVHYLLFQGSDPVTQTMTAVQAGQCVALALGVVALIALGARAVPASP
ncbi:hypothetical protein C1I98_18955 [Spongiactinospora gelatinilytica]|uniref:Uncharacterized protein n=1 Tax=Spongiactinospora gelatinilytica TaxID=2666298 RepID=A0A2W2G4Y7_9ACTN|nr:hypothetical protein [Spongiactinospora gelatinilytica]PZG43093.1 hypothetical protein C1I98_18955 [Spongiactinospora gelatinilytica]